MDLSRFHAVFVEEAAEHIENLENGLLQLEKNPDDAELLNDIFRSAHTIKGSSGTVGLPDISRFTHVIEELLDDLRNKALTLHSDMISTLLEALDTIKEMIAAVGDKTEFEFSRCEPLMERIRGLQGKQTPETSTSQPPTPTLTGEHEGHLFLISFIPSPDLFRQGCDPAKLLDELAELGSIESIQADTDAVPPLAELDPETLYLSWMLKLRTNVDKAAIQDVFVFVEDDCTIEITPLMTPQQEIPLLGKLLTEEGIVSEEDVRQALTKQKRLGEILVSQGKTSQAEISKVLDKQGIKKAESFKKAVSSSIRVDLNKLDNLVNLVGEMVITQSMFQQVMAEWQLGSTNGFGNATERTDRLFSQLQRIGKDIQEGTMALRMLPVGEVFQRFSRLVRELSTSKGKDIELVISGEDTELDKGVLEKVTDPLVHLIRNAVDHGIESTEDRIVAGKSAKSTVFLRAYQLGDAVYIEVEDDGRGLDRDRIIAKALANGVISSEVGLSEDEICNLIFLPGFSTADKITDISGRGVGMDVVKRNIESLKGSVQVRTRKGHGTTISIRLPLTLAIIDGLAANVGDEVFIIPIASVVESLRPTQQVVHTVEEQGEVVNVRGEYIPLIRLSQVLEIPGKQQNPWEAIVVVTHYQNRKYGLMVDELLGEQQVVLKNLGSATPKVQDISGGTIMGDGRVALVLDVAGIVQMAHH
jgi:two-component system, chemotaxis family, sensor kinase CheA